VQDVDGLGEVTGPVGAAAELGQDLPCLELRVRSSADTEHAEAVTVLARAHQDAVWRLHRVGNELRSLLREYFPAFLEIFAKQEGGITCREARAILAIASTPGAAAKLTGPRIRAALKRCGRIYHLDAWTEKIHRVLHASAPATCSG
jgi:hypothetical protein